MLVIALLACTTTAVVGDGVSSEGDPEVEHTGEETGEIIEEPQPETVWEDYEGSRTYVATTDWGGCDESTEDEGEELLEGEEYDQIKAACPDCEHIFENDPVEDSVCYGIIPLSRSWRSVDLNDEGTGAELSFYLEDEGVVTAWTSVEVSFDKSLMPFEYEFELYGYPVTVTGEMVFEVEIPE